MRKDKKGFTLIELLVVIAIIGLLTALSVVNFNAARERARDVQRKSDLNNIKKALRLYYNDYGGYPADSGGEIVACGSGDTPTNCSWSGIWTRGTMVYMKILPQDPVPDETYTYSQEASAQDFCLSATLENQSDNNIESSQTRCSACSVGDNDYAVCAD